MVAINFGTGIVNFLTLVEKSKSPVLNRLNEFMKHKPIISH